MKTKMAIWNVRLACYAFKLPRFLLIKSEGYEASAELWDFCLSDCAEYAIIELSFSLFGGMTMAISYKKLWKLLIDKDMTAVELRERTGIAPNTMTKLRRDEEVSMAVLIKICAALEANIGDIMDVVPGN